MKAGYFSLAVLSSISFLIAPLEATYMYKAGKLINTKEAAWMSVQEHYAAAMDAYGKKHWLDLVQHAIVVTTNFPDSAFANDAIYYLGIGYYQLKDYELANRQFSAYLKKQEAPKHFEDAINYKYLIAERFEKGAKKHMMGFKSLPQWLPAQDEAVAIYDEVITALPNHELAAKAMYGKARLLLMQEEFTDAVETAQTLIRRFPKHPLSPKSYLLIATAYLKQVRAEYPDPDLLDLAEINLKKYSQDFPSDERIDEAQKCFANMQEIYAKQLLQIGKFYQKTKKTNAADLYYHKILVRFPNTQVAQEVLKANKHLTVANPTLLQTELPAFVHESNSAEAKK